MAAKASVKRVWEVCGPHPDVFARDPNPSLFVISLHQVEEGTADRDYTDPERFFAKTYMTYSLKNLLEGVIGRLAGIEGKGAPVLQLQTPFGGGKTHTLVSFYHLAHHPEEASEALRDILERLNLKSVPDNIRCVVLDGSALSQTPRGREANGIRIQTLWGELAYRLGGRAFYERVREEDEARIPPGLPVIQDMLKESAPVLILVDELTQYLLTAEGVPVGDSNLLVQTGVFLQRLTDAVRNTPKAVMAVSLPASPRQVTADEEKAMRILSFTSQVLGRTELVETPVAGDEVFEVLKRRLFRNPGERRDAKRVVEAYWDYYREFARFFPDRVRRPDYRERMLKAYPFHPELVDLLYERWGPHSKFQRTRGALRLLAFVLRRVFYQRPGSAFLIQPYNVDLMDRHIRGEVVKLRGETFEFDPIVTGDIGNRAGEVERNLGGDYYKESLARGAATCIFLYSISAFAGEAGATEEDIRIALLRPGINPAMCSEVLSRLRDVDGLWYLWYRDRYYTFRARPNLTKVILDHEGTISEDQVEEGLLEQTRRAAGEGKSKLQVRVWPQTHEYIPDSDKPQLILLPLTLSEKEKAEEWMKKAVAYFGEVPRIYRNGLIFLAPLGVDSARLKTKSKRLLALRAIKSSPTYRTMEEEDRKGLEEQLKQVEGELGELLRQAYGHLYRPSPEGVEKIPFVSRERQPKATLSEQVEIVLREQGVLLETLDPQYLIDRVLKDKQDVSIAEVETRILGVPGEEPILTGGRDGLENSVLQAIHDGRIAVEEGGKVLTGAEVTQEHLRKGRLTTQVKPPSKEEPTEPQYFGIRIETTPSMLYPLLKAAEFLRSIQGQAALEVRDTTGGKDLKKVEKELKKLVEDYKLTHEWLSSREET